MVPGRHTVRRSVVGAQSASGGFNWGGGGRGGGGRRGRGVSTMQVWKYWALRSTEKFYNYLF